MRCDDVSESTIDDGSSSSSNEDYFTSINWRRQDSGASDCDYTTPPKDDDDGVRATWDWHWDQSEEETRDETYIRRKDDVKDIESRAEK